MIIRVKKYCLRLSSNKVTIDHKDAFLSQARKQSRTYTGTKHSIIMMESKDGILPSKNEFLPRSLAWISQASPFVLQR